MEEYPGKEKHILEKLRASLSNLDDESLYDLEKISKTNLTPLQNPQLRL